MKKEVSTVLLNVLFVSLLVITIGLGVYYWFFVNEEDKPIEIVDPPIVKIEEEKTIDDYKNDEYTFVTAKTIDNNLNYKKTKEINNNPFTVICTTDIDGSIGIDENKKLYVKYNNQIVYADFENIIDYEVETIALADDTRGIYILTDGDIYYLHINYNDSAEIFNDNIEKFSKKAIKLEGKYQKLMSIGEYNDQYVVEDENEELFIIEIVENRIKKIPVIDQYPYYFNNINDGNMEVKGSEFFYFSVDMKGNLYGINDVQNELKILEYENETIKFNYVFEVFDKLEDKRMEYYFIDRNLNLYRWKYNKLNSFDKLKYDSKVKYIGNKLSDTNNIYLTSNSYLIVLENNQIIKLKGSLYTDDIDEKKFVNYYWFGSKY